ncbi:MAG: 30S ribosome-binding factor RbfA, partial [Alphaproteobacteria bacterium]
MKSQRQLQIAENIKRTMSEIFLREDYSVIMNNVITVLQADVSPDAKNVKIFIDICGDSSKHSQILEKINENTPNFRYLLAQKIDLRFIPEITFLQDKNINNSLIIESLINQEKQ